MEDELKAMREESAKLRERVAVLETYPRPTGGVMIDWSKPLMIGTPRCVTGAIPPGTITCN
jgi:hypothetical protein